MSQHFVRPNEPPPGITSFTKIRLGWIQPHQASVVKPEEGAQVFLAPLSGKGNLYVVKVPLPDGTYYLIENRQHVGYDKQTPDTGLLVLKISPQAPEGYGTAEVKVPGSGRDFSKATLKPGVRGRDMYINERDNVAILPLWYEEKSLGVLVTTPEKSGEALKAASSIHGLMERGGRNNRTVQEAIAAFRNGDFTRSYEIASRRDQ